MQNEISFPGSPTLWAGSFTIFLQLIEFIAYCILIREHPCPCASVLCGLLSTFPFALWKGFVYSHCHNQTPLSFRFSAFEVTLSGFADGEYLPLPASEGPAFPFPSAPLRTSSAHPRWVPHLSRNVRSGTTVFSKNSGNSSYYCGCFFKNGGVNWIVSIHNYT